MSTKTRSTSSLIRIIQGGSGRISVHKSYVVKKVKIKDFPSPTSEIFLLSKLNHPNIIKILSWKVNGEYLSFRLQRMEMDLAHFVRENRPDEILLKLRDQMLTVVAYLHSLDVIHGDLTDSNFLVSSDASIRLADFGTSFYARYTTNVGESLCRLRYDAPESVLFRKECEWEAPPLIKLKKRDSWALGMCFVSLFNHGKVPEGKKETFKIFSHTFGGPYPSDSPAPDLFGGSPLVTEDIRRLLRFYPWERASVQDLVLIDVRPTRLDLLREKTPEEDVETYLSEMATELAKRLDVDETSLRPLVWNYYGFDTDELNIDSQTLRKVIELL